MHKKGIIQISKTGIQTNNIQPGIKLSL